MSQPVDYYKLLHVQRDAPEAVIKASYRAMMQKMQYHPDLGGDAELAKQLNLAVGVLCNEAQRAGYDNILAAWQEGHAPKTEASPRDETAGKDNSDRQNQRESKEHDSACSSSSNPPPHAAKSPFSLPIKPGCKFCHSTRSDRPLGSPYADAKSDACQLCGAAATPIHDINDSDTGELRRLHRHLSTMHAEYWQRWPQSTPLLGTVIDFSPVGCAMECAEQLATGHVLKMETALFKAVCHVCDCRAGRQSDKFILGLAFVNLNLRANPGSLLSTVA